MLKHIIGYSACALVILISLYSWHSKDKELDALNTKLESANEIIKEKAKESEREDEATSKRDEQFESLDKGLADVQKTLRRLQKDNAELRNILSTVIPSEPLFKLHSYAGNQHETAGTKSSASPSTNTKKP